VTLDLDVSMWMKYREYLESKNKMASGWFR